MLNQTVLQGRLVKDPELRYTQSGIPVASFRIAVDRDYAKKGEEKKTDFLDLSAWRSTGEFVKKYFRKGDMIVVTGSIQTRKYEDRDGNKRTAWEIKVDSVHFCGGKKSSGEAQKPEQLQELEDDGSPFEDADDAPFDMSDDDKLPL